MKESLKQPSRVYAPQESGGAGASSKRKSKQDKKASPISGYGSGNVSTVISVSQVAKEVSEIASKKPSITELQNLTEIKPTSKKQAKQKSPPAKTAHYLAFENITAGYGKTTILFDFNLYLNKGQSLCLIGPNGAGKSTILHTLYGMTTITNGTIYLNNQDITHLPPNKKLQEVKVAYLLQENSVFPNMTIEENLLMGGYLMPTLAEAHEKMERVLEKYDRLRNRRTQKASVLSGGERRLLEISRALIMEPEVLLIDEPSIGLEPRFIDMVFEILKDLKEAEHKTILMVEQNAKKGLEFADLAYVLVNGQVALAGEGKDLLKNPRVGKLFLGG